MKIKILWLYANEMNIYGDYGNILALQKQADLRGINTEVIKYSVGDTFPEDVDIVIGGGGQDSGQNKIQKDLARIAPQLKKMADKNIPMLMICGLYQLFGDYFETSTGEKIKGIGVFKGTKTIAGSDRLIGNICEHSSEFGDIIGYENHSGQTYVNKSLTPLGHCSEDIGNNTKDATEGAKFKNVIGTYLHGSALPKNPRITLFFLEKIAENKGEKLPNILPSKEVEASNLEIITEKAREIAKNRPR